ATDGGDALAELGGAPVEAGAGAPERLAGPACLGLSAGPGDAAARAREVPGEGRESSGNPGERESDGSGEGHRRERSTLDGTIPHGRSRGGECGVSATTNRRNDPGGLSSEAMLVWAALIAVVTTLGGLWVSMHLGHRLAGTGTVVPMNPFEVAF